MATTNLEHSDDFNVTDQNCGLGHTIGPQCWPC